ncbi:GntR family transcriptional regulator [Actinomadura sp. KC06]|uniref:GntR family transcriptional regulator n=1 Tax=Actinomadura sp. KC06 TaxID=2530369 RepID=UPI001049DEAE|nr:GntR family transcriptional regulator [Actinomadura sp. KC06]TDD35255.1 GntR family transcriptional regulator [Actinomadura sp. KC06]
MTVDLDGPDPLWQQIAGVLRSRIESGTYPPNRRIPSEEALCEEFGVARPTVRRAISTLRAEGRLRAVRGRGTFVIEQAGDGE